MPFRTELITGWIRGTNDVALYQPLIYWDNRTKQEFAFDTGSRSNGASIPRIPLLWTIIGHPWDGDYRDGAVLHDLLYRNLVAEGAMKKIVADQMFYDAIRELGCPEWKAQLMYQAVRRFGRARTQQELDLAKGIIT